MNMLSLTFRGPFLFEVPLPKAGIPSPTVNIYAPQCDAHLGSIFYGNRSLAFYGSCAGGQNQAYVLTGQVPLPGYIGLVTNTGKISYQWDAANAGSNSILTPDNPPVAYTPKVSNCYFMTFVYMKIRSEFLGLSPYAEFPAEDTGRPLRASHRK